MTSADRKPEIPERAVISLGSNIDDRMKYIQKCIDIWRESRDVDVIAVSSIFETVPVHKPGDKFDGDFLNACIVCDVLLSPLGLLELCQIIERKCGRDRELEKVTGRGNRTLDCDIIFYGDHEIHHATPDLVIPHPRWHEREFVIKPMMALMEHLTAWQAGELGSSALISKDVQDA